MGSSPTWRFAIDQELYMIDAIECDMLLLNITLTITGIVNIYMLKVIHI